MKDTYKTIELLSTPTLFKEKGSKFFGYAFPVSTSNAVKTHLESVKKAHHSARHWCYAYQLGTENNITFRVNDDGEPSNTAGMPIYGQLKAFDVTNTLIIIVRYFGGVKLGVGGLIQAYRTSAQLTLEACNIVEKILTTDYIIRFEYKDMNKVMRIIKEHNIVIKAQELQLSCTLTIRVRKKDTEQVHAIFKTFYGVTIKTV